MNLLNRQRRIGLGLILTVLIGLPAVTPARAADGYAQPAEGMSYRDVLKIWGRPLEKQEQESKRQDWWLYHTKKVVFKNGKVVSVQDLEGASAPMPTPLDGVGVKTADAESFGSSKDKDAVAVEDILKEIMRGAASAPEDKNKPRPFGEPPIRPAL